MKKNIKIFLIALLVFIFGNLTIVSATQNEGIRYEENKGALQYIKEIEGLLEENFGSLKKFNEVGGLYFDDNGVAHIGLKKQTSENTEIAKEISNIVGDNYIELEQVTYSTTELDKLRESVLNEIVSFLSEDDYKSSFFTLDASFNNQQMVLTYDHEGLPEDLINKLKVEYHDNLLFEEVDLELSPTKARNDDWNQLVSGLGINNGDCTTGAFFVKNGNYFLSTAGHCFTSNTSPTGGSLVKQNNANVGRQHADGRYYGYDIGLIRITNDNTLPYGRYATSGLKRVESGTYNSRFSSWSNVYIGQTACKSGITTQQTCGSVNSVSMSVKYPDETYTFNVARVGGLNWTLPGDSGAGVYNNSAAATTSYLGNVSGRYFVNGETRGGFFTKFSDVADFYEVALYTSTNNYKIVD